MVLFRGENREDKFEHGHLSAVPSAPRDPLASDASAVGAPDDTDSSPNANPPVWKRVTASSGLKPKTVTKVT